MPKTAMGYAKFAAAVFVALVIINSVSRRVPALAQIAQGF